MSIYVAAVNFALAYRAARVAKKEWHAYLDNAWGPRPEPGELSDRHSFGHCRVDLDEYGTTAPLCEICAGSEALHASYRKAVTKRQGALRTLLHQVRA